MASKSAFHLLGRISKLTDAVATVTCGGTELFAFAFSDVGDRANVIGKAIDADIKVRFGLFFPLSCSDAH